MLGSRRHLLAMLSATLGSLFFGTQEPVGAQAPGSHNRPPRLPGETPDDNENSSNPLAPNANKLMLEQRQKDIKKEVERLYQLASELKTQVEKTDATTVLSLSLLKKAEEIEKLARQIRDNAKG